MKLIGSLTSPFVRKVRVVLAEKKIECGFEIDSPWTPESNVPKLNPLGKIPALALDDDIVLFDSRVISEYLDNVAPNNKLMPAPNRERTEVKRWEALADGVCDAAALVFLERKRPETQQSADWIARQKDKILRGLEYMDLDLG
ncbi:MAG: glutathione S-transferase N-terminal domain-containing protein, partial [Azoarcus sp.]|nr:glutathione S-transferase N-terminal domain-containing protein [Azoarcus sp.]